MGEGGGNHEFKASLGYTVRSCLKKENETNKKSNKMSAS
jgi:hypothetical protein